MDLDAIGWNAAWERDLAALGDAELAPARVARVNGASLAVLTRAGEVRAEVSGRLRHEAVEGSELPAVGDWVAVVLLDDGDHALVHAVLPRRSCFSRQEAGQRSVEQVLAANIDIAFLVMGLDRDYNPARLERYLTLAWDSGASPVIVLNKADVCAEVGSRTAEVEAIACGVPVHTVSAAQGTGVEQLLAHLGHGRTGALLGSSGVGKSTLINRLLGQDQLAVGEVRDNDGRGRHTTTHREMVLLPGGGVLIDNPGMREVQLWADEEDLADTFGDVEDLAEGCRFRDCRHDREPGCAVRGALDSGALSPKRYESYCKMLKELRYLASRQDQRQRAQFDQRGKDIARFARQLHKGR